MKETGIKSITLNCDGRVIVEGSKQHECEILEQPIVGARPKFWIKKLAESQSDKNWIEETVLVKKGLERENIGEAIFSKICEHTNDNTTNVDYVPYSLAKLTESQDGIKNESIVTTCPSYFENGLNPLMERSGEKIYRQHIDLGFRENDIMQEQDLFLSIDGYDLMLQEMLNPENNETTSNEINKSITHLKKMAILDYLTYQSDRHFKNFSFFVGKESDTNRKTVSPVPIYDSGNIFGLSENSKEEIVSKPPFLGISTPMTYVKNIEHGRPRIANINPAERENLLSVFEQELATMIVSDSELSQFYKTARKINMPLILEEINNQAGNDRLDKNTNDLINNLWSDRVKQIDEICVTRDNNFLKDKEAEKGVDL